MQILRHRSMWLGLIVASFLFSTGCGGDAYEKKFDESLQHVKSTGKPLGQEPAPPPAADNGNQQQPQQ